MILEYLPFYITKSENRFQVPDGLTWYRTQKLNHCECTFSNFQILNPIHMHNQKTLPRVYTRATYQRFAIHLQAFLCQYLN